jgi:hypothetical protein
MVKIDPSIKYQLSNTNDSCELDIPRLNQNDNVKISIFATSDQPLPVKPVISVRGKGVTGIPYSAKSSGDPFQILSSIIGLFSAVFTSYLVFKKRNEW